MRLLASLVFVSSLLALNGCALQETAAPGTYAGVAIQGQVHGGNQPVTGARVYLMQMGTTGYGSAATSLLTSGTASDSIGFYVSTTTGGSFTLTGRYTCTVGTQVYALALGGNPGLGAGTNNTAIAMLAVLGTCPAGGSLATTSPFISLNEVTTVAGVYALAGFMTGPTTVGSSSTNLSVGLANAVANAGLLASSIDGRAPTVSPYGNGALPYKTINTIANILTACINTDGTISSGIPSTPSSPTNCYTLFNNAKNGSAIPTDTITATLNMVHFPSNNVANLFGLASANAAFQPALTSAPSDFGLSIPFTVDSNTNSPPPIAIDASGNIYRVDGANSTRKVSPQGVILQTLTSSVENFTYGAGIDPVSGNVWVFNGNTTKYAVYNSAGVSQSASGVNPVNYPRALAFDNSSNVYSLLNSAKLSVIQSVSPFTNVSGSPFTIAGAGAGNFDTNIAITAAGKVWTTTGTKVGRSLTTGADDTGGTGVTGNGIGNTGVFPGQIAADSNQNVWIPQFGSSSNFLSGWKADGTAVSGSPFTLTTSLGSLPYLAVDGANDLWLGSSIGFAHYTNAAVLVGTLVNNNYTQGYCMADQSGNLWCSSGSALLEYVGAAAPTAQPLAMNKYGTKP